MKKLISTLSMVILALQGFSQITITNTDMPSVGDTFRVSNGLITPLIDPVPTGSSFVWDFSTLQMVTQDVDSFVDVSSTGAIFSLVFFNLPFNPNRANLAAKGPSLPAIPQVTITDVNYFYYNSSASYEVSGYGATINSIQAPIPFNNKDRIYDFPVNFGNIDSSDSDFQLGLPGLGYYGHDQHRVNEVDGWGTLTTPFGSFNTIRVKSVITSNDSVYLDTLGTGFAFSLPPTTEYKWLGAQSGIPLLQINTTNTLGIEVVSSIVYRDSLRTLTGLQDIEAHQTTSFNVYPNPSDGIIDIQIARAHVEKATLSLLSADGKLIAPIWSGVLKEGSNSIAINLDELHISTGVYFIELLSGSNKAYKSLIIKR